MYQTPTQLATRYDDGLVHEGEAASTIGCKHAAHPACTLELHSEVLVMLKCAMKNAAIAELPVELGARKNGVWQMENIAYCVALQY
jgi:hypothetical protein